jgi:hypothetical protein
LRRAAFAALVTALMPLPLAAASDPTAPSTKPKTLQAAVRAAAVRDSAVVAAPRAKAPARAAQAGTSKQSSSFFRSGPGAVALAVMIVGSGYAIYSVSHDRIHSAGKK